MRYRTGSSLDGGIVLRDAARVPDPAPNSLSIFFGNPSKFYTIIRRLGVRFLVDPYTQPPYVKLLAFERVGGGVHKFEAGKLVRFANS
jgi:HK97 family phage major capsid protein